MFRDSKLYFSAPLLLDRFPETLEHVQPTHAHACARAERVHKTPWRCNLGSLHKLPHTASLLSSSSWSPSALLKLSNKQIKETQGNLDWNRENKEERVCRAGLYCRVCVRMYVCVCLLYALWTDISVRRHTFCFGALFNLKQGGGNRKERRGRGGESCSEHLEETGRLETGDRRTTANWL